MGFFTTIRTNFGESTVIALKEWANINNKLARFRNRRILLLNCRRTGIFPRHISQSLKSINSLLDGSGTVTREIEKFNKKISA